MIARCQFDLQYQILAYILSILQQLAVLPGLRADSQGVMGKCQQESKIFTASVEDY